VFSQHELHVALGRFKAGRTDRETERFYCGGPAVVPDPELAFEAYAGCDSEFYAMSVHRTTPSQTRDAVLYADSVGERDTNPEISLAALPQEL